MNRYFFPCVASFILIVSLTVHSQLKDDFPDFLSALEKEVVAELNFARTRPKEYAELLEAQRKYYSNKIYTAPGTDPKEMVEGIAALNEAIEFLKNVTPLPQLKVSQGMCFAARDQAADLGLSGGTGHKGSDGSTPEDRLNRYGRWLTPVAENIVYTGESARSIVIGWIIDDGVKSRGHRKNIFSESHTIAGISIHSRTDPGKLCVITFAGDYTEKPGDSKPAARRSF